jgi:pimeloyl-ACP methyl ester carboxylesterase
MRLTILTLVLLSACHQDDQGPSAAMPRYDLLKPCEPTELHRRSPIDAESLCGTITVFEDRAQGAGRTIDLNVMVIPAVDNVAKPDPIFFLAGGPGQAATDVGPDFFAQMPRLRAHRDIVLVDQRGTGSSNSLSCRPDDDTINHLGTTLDELVQRRYATLYHADRHGRSE